MLSYPDYLFNTHKDFFSQDLGNDKKIFILGSSHIKAINPETVVAYLEKNDYHFDVYNLGNVSDDFEERERTMDMIISKKPDFVIYGIEPRAFESAGRTISQTVESPLFHIGNIAELFDMIDLGDKKGVFKNPKFALIRSVSSSEEIQIRQYTNSPFFEFDPDGNKIKQPNELMNVKREYVTKINPPGTNSNLNSLNNILEKLEKNNINTMVFVTPHSKFYLENYPDNQEKIFQEILSIIAKKHELTIYSTYDKYAELTIWHDHTHLAISDETSLYSKDLASFIIKELEK